MLVAAATFTLILEFNPIQEEAMPSRRRNRRIGVLLDTTRAVRATVLSQELPGTNLLAVTVSDVLDFAYLPR
jgi:hypothetical protein